MRQTLSGIVLASGTVGEYDKRVVLLTKEEGRISAFARGARRPKSTLSAGTEPMCFGNFYIYRGRDSYTIDDTRIDNYFPDLKSNLDKLYMGLYLLEVADYFTREGMGAGSELELLYRSLLALQVETIPDELVRLIYELRMLIVSGYSPRYDEDRKVWMDDIGVWNISEGASYTVGQIVSLPLAKLYTFTVSDSALAELKQVIGAFFKRNTDRDFNTLRTLEAMKGI